MQIDHWNKNNNHVRNIETKIEPKIIPTTLNEAPPYQQDMFFDNSRIQKPITAGNIKLSNPAIKLDNITYTSTNVPNVPYNKPMPTNKCRLAYCTY